MVPTPGNPDTPKWVLPASAVAAVAILIVALVLIGVRGGTTDDDAAGISTPITEVTTSPSEPASESTTAEPETTDAATTSTAVTTTTVETTTPDSTVTPGPPATLTAEAPYFGEPTTVTLDLVGTQNGLTVYDGLIEVPELRCVAALAPAIDGWNEWCGAPDMPIRFLTGDGTTMWLVELGADVGTITVSVPPIDWTLTANGCSSPVIGVLDAAFPGPAVMTGAVCVPGEAFVNNSATLLQPGSPDGGGSVVEQAANGTWTSLGGGTSSPCDSFDDGADRCGAYGLEVGDELFDALLPIPPIGGGSATADVVGVRDLTAGVRAVIGSSTSAADIGAAVAAAFRDGTEDPAPTVETFGQFGWWNVELVIVTIPAFDDSVLSTTYAIWVGVAPNEPVVHAVAFETCARGLAGSDLCI